MAPVHILTIRIHTCTAVAEVGRFCCFSKYAAVCVHGAAKSSRLSFRWKLVTTLSARSCVRHGVTCRMYVARRDNPFLGQLGSGVRFIPSRSVWRCSKSCRGQRNGGAANLSVATRGGKGGDFVVLSACCTNTLMVGMFGWMCGRRDGSSYAVVYLLLLLLAV